MDVSADSHNPSVEPRSGAFAWFFNPYLQIIFGALLVTASELLLRQGASSKEPAAGLAKWLGIAAFGSGYTWLGIVTYILSFACWLYVLRFVPLSIAFPAINITHVLVPLGAWVFLHEHFSPQRWVGVALVLCGILLIVRPVIAAEKKL
jgi:drug/metabolite transporter (DMT)-like permease